MSAHPEERPPRVGLKMLLRAGLAALAIAVVSGAAVSTAVIREIEQTVSDFTRGGRTLPPIPELDREEVGGARTIMILGSDKRKGIDSESPARADTILLVRADPDKDSIGVTSIPRDLSVHIPGYGKSKINYAYERGKERLTVRTVKKLFEDATGEKFPINNVITVDYGGFRRAVDYIGGVYVDIDRDYFNDNSSGQNYATIDIDAGYQKLRGRDALDYVRYRHTDNDLVRAARQQDFLRQAKNAGGLRELMSFSERRHLARAFNRYFEVDDSFNDTGEVLEMLKLALYLAQDQPTVNEVRFRVREADNPQIDSNLYASTGALRTIHRELMSTEGSATPRKSSRPTDEDREFERVRKQRKRKRGPVPELENAAAEGENQAVLAGPKLDFPFYFPEQRLVGSRHAGTEPRIYRLRDEERKRHEAYRLVYQAPGIGQYYGVQGMTWKRPPILDNPDDKVRRGGRRFRIYKDGSKVRLVAWKTKRGTYWVSNTLTLLLTPDQMLEIAASMRRLGG